MSLNQILLNQKEDKAYRQNNNKFQHFDPRPLRCLGGCGEGGSHILTITTIKILPRLNK